MKNVFDVTDFGAVGDGTNDCTAAFQAAIDEAEKVKGAVLVPPGTYLCNTIYMKPSVTLQGFSGWGYRETGGSVIKLLSGGSKCLIDMSGAFGGRLLDLQLLGNHCAGNGVHGVYVWWEDQESRLHNNHAREDNCIPETCQIGFREDSITVERCCIKNFSGDAIHLWRIWAFTVKSCMLIANKSNGIYINGWDGWISDCVMHTNRGAAIFSDNICAAITMTGNRIEWNRGGIDLTNASSLNITGNYFDRSYGPAVRLFGSWFSCNNITFTGNIFNRSGKYLPSFEEDMYLNCHLYFDNCHNLALSGNTFLTGRDDFGESPFSPDYGLVYKKLRFSSFTGNTMYGGAMIEKICDLGESSDNCFIANAGIAPPDDSEKPGNGTYE